jgi:hypothetical protein
MNQHFPMPAGRLERLVANLLDSMFLIILSLFWFAPILFNAERIGYHAHLRKTRVIVGKIL